MYFKNTLEFAQELDAADGLKSHREAFYFPSFNEKNCLYFCGNSLGLQPKAVKNALLSELEHWQKYGVEGHFKGQMPWLHYHKFLTPQSANLVGAHPDEVVVMNTLTTNLHLMMVSFYRPTAQRFKIIMEAGAFPSDQYAVESQVRWHGFLPENAVIEVAPRAGEDTLRTEDIVEMIAQHQENVALVLFGGVNYYTGQFFDIQAITKATHAAGAYAGFDLAHAAGNVPLCLHDWGVDFAVWCSYKYLNAGPGGPSGAFIHQRHGDNPHLPRFAGWWGHEEASRFQMKKGFVPMHGAAGWQLSNAQIFSFAAHKVSLDLFEAAGMKNLRDKSIRLTNFLEFILSEIHASGKHHFQIITPKNQAERGGQLSILTDENGKLLHDFLTEKGVICDWREPNVIRLAPVPMYNSFQDIFELGAIISAK